MTCKRAASSVTASFRRQSHTLRTNDQSQVVVGTKALVRHVFSRSSSTHVFTQSLYKAGEVHSKLLPLALQTWEGPVKDGWIPDKVGTATFPGGDIYVGNYENGKKNGNGKYTWAKGGVYEGQYSNDQRNGYGIMKYPDKGVYAGAWFRGRRHGEGLYTYPNGDQYQGQWRDDQRHGQGTYYFVESMSSFIGIWQSGSFVNGEWTWRDGSTYVGKYYEDRPIGSGVYKFVGTNNELRGYYERFVLPPNLSTERLKKLKKKKKKPKKLPKKPPPPPPPIIKLEFQYPELRTRAVKSGKY